MLDTVASGYLVALNTLAAFGPDAGQALGSAAAGPLAGEGSLPLPLTRLRELSWFDVFLNYPPVKALLPIPVLFALAPVIWWFFGETWRRLEAEATEYRVSLPPG